MTNTTVKAREIELKTISWRRAACFSGTSREQTTVSPPMWNPRRQADEGFVLASQARHQVYYPRQVREDVDDI